MRSKDKIDVVTSTKIKPDGMPWAIVRFRGAREWVPSFEDLFRVVLAIVYCERVKYAYLPRRPSAKVAAFMLDAVRAADRVLDKSSTYEAEWAKLDADHELTEGRRRAAYRAGLQ